VLTGILAASLAPIRRIPVEPELLPAAGHDTAELAGAPA
jgi:hypothetical protein